MKIHAGIAFNEDGITQSIRAMHMQTKLFEIGMDNISGFDKIGYQRKDPVVSSFSEWIGIHGISTALDDEVGRLLDSQKPLDVALGKKGYFQMLYPDGTIKMTRDGRLHMTKDGQLLNLENAKVLSEYGTPIVFDRVPENLDYIRISTDGTVGVFDKLTGKVERVSKLAVVTDKGAMVPQPDVRQGYNEHSNVSMHYEFLQLSPARRNFDANRQLFQIQNSNLSKAIQELGRSS